MDTVRPLLVGMITAAIAWALGPSLPWWLVGAIAAVVLIVNPCTPRRPR